jgi:hypothetical protein
MEVDGRLGNSGKRFANAAVSNSTNPYNKKKKT